MYLQVIAKLLEHLLVVWLRLGYMSLLDMLRWLCLVHGMWLIHCKGALIILNQKVMWLSHIRLEAALLRNRALIWIDCIGICVGSSNSGVCSSLLFLFPNLT